MLIMNDASRACDISDVVVESVITSTPGSVDVVVDYEPGTPTTHISRVDS